MHGVNLTRPSESHELPRSTSAFEVPDLPLAPACQSAEPRCGLIEHKIRTVAVPVLVR